MVLDRERIASDQIFPVFGDGGGRGLELAPGPGLAEADDTGVGMDADVEESVQQQRFDLGDLHRASPCSRRL